MTQRAIEVSFPIVEINRLAVPERNAFKPIYQMHKWFARRASCVFRAILLGCLKPAGTDIMAEFYKVHTHDPDTNGNVILDPFMGGGTTVVEALRLGCKVIGIDLNPVAWFIVKTEVEPVDIDELKAAFDRLANRIVPWSGKSIRETLLEQYKTECPCCHREADIIYTFWVKSAICHNENCPGRSGDRGPEVPLFSNYIIAQKSPSIRYWRDVTCPKCQKTFDWEIEPAALVAEESLRVNAPRSAGEGRPTSRWAFSAGQSVECPWCEEDVQPAPPKSKKPGTKAKPERKKVPLAVLLCPKCDSVWQYRGDLPDNVSCPICTHNYGPHVGNVPDSGKFLCLHCGTKEHIIASIRRLHGNQLLPMRPYAIEGYCVHCGGHNPEESDGEAEEDETLVGRKRKRVTSKRTLPDHECPLTRNGGKYYMRMTSSDLAVFQQASETWARECEGLPHPQQEIPVGEKTKSGLLAHHYQYWYQLFNPRQLLCLGTLLAAILAEEAPVLRNLLLSAFFCTLEANNMFARYRPNSGGRSPFGGIFARHDFQPKLTPCEINVWGPYPYYGVFSACFGKVVEGKEHCWKPHDTKYINGKRVSVRSAERIIGAEDNPSLYAGSSTSLNPIGNRLADLIITDPPYAGNVNYSELSDFFYVWLRLVLAKEHREFAPELTPKAEEIIENPARGKTAEDFEQGLKQVFQACYRISSDNASLVFTFHHAEGSAWESLLRAVCNAGYEIDCVYPIHGESESSMHLLGKEGAISYDLIHVCKKRNPNSTIEKRSWAGIRQEIRRRAREEIRAIEAGRYGNEPLSPADVNIILIGKCLELYSRHYGAVIDGGGNEVPLHDALIEIRNMVDQLVEKQRPLPSELEDIDAESRVYLLTLATQKEIKSDDVHKATRGILEPDDLMRAGLMIKGRAKRGRTFEVKQPRERLPDLLDAFTPDGSGAAQMSLFDEAPAVKTRRRTLFIDEIHLLLGLAESGENLMPWLERFGGDRSRIRAACEYLTNRNKTFAEACNKVLRLLDPGPLFRNVG